MAVLKLLVPIAAWRQWTSRVLTVLAECWIAGNGAIFGVMRAMPMSVAGLEGLETRQWYLVVSNHRSWVDILVLQSIFNRRIPFLKFFLKRELIWVPLLGLAWWALDFPFMRRYSSDFLARHPHLRGKDLEATRRACERFRRMPTSVMNFVEGTRFTDAKRIETGSPLPRAAAAAGRRYLVRAVRDGRDPALDARRHHRLPGADAEPVGSVLRAARRAWSSTCASARSRGGWRRATTRATPRFASGSRPGWPASGPRRTSSS